MFIEYYECAAGNQHQESNQVKRERKTEHHAQPENQIIAIIDRNKSNIYLTYNKNQSYSVGSLYCNKPDWPENREENEGSKRRVDLTSFRKFESRSLRQLDACLIQRSERLSERKMRFSSSELGTNSSNKYSFTVDRPNSLLSANLITLIRFSNKLTPSLMASFASSYLTHAKESFASLSSSSTSCCCSNLISFVALRHKHWLTVLKPLSLILADKDASCSSDKCA